MKLIDIVCVLLVANFGLICLLIIDEIIARIEKALYYHEERKDLRFRK